MKKIMMVAVVLVNSVAAFAETNCNDLVKKTVATLAAGASPVTGHYGVTIETLKENVVLKREDGAGVVSSIQVDVLRATAFSGSYGTTYHAWVAEGYQSKKGCSILKITQEGVR